MPSDLDEMAAHGRRMRAKAKEHRRDAPTPPPTPREPELNDVSRMSLTTDLGTVVSFLALVACVAPVGVGKALDWPKDTLLVTVCASAVLGALVAVVGYLTRGLVQLSWVRRLPWLDAGDYLSQLGQSFHEAAMRVEVRFAQPVPDARRGVVADAALGASGAKSARFKGDLLVVESRREKTCFHSRMSSASGSYHSNRALHSWFRKLVRKGLRVIGAEHPLAEIRVTIHGRG